MAARVIPERVAGREGRPLQPGERAADRRDGLGVEHVFGPAGPAETVVLGKFRIGCSWQSDDELGITDPTGGRHTIRFRRNGVVERSLAWVGQARRLKIRYDKLPSIHRAFHFLQLARICCTILQRDYC